MNYFNREKYPKRYIYIYKKMFDIIKLFFILDISI